MLFFCTENKILRRMSKTACKKKDYKKPEEARFRCEKCESTAKKKKKLCKPQKIKHDTASV